MAENIGELDFSRKITRADLLVIIKKEANSLPMQDIMNATSFLREDAKYMPAGYREEYIQRFSKAFFLRIKDVKEDHEEYPGEVNTMRLQGFLEVIERQQDEAKSKNELCFLKIAKIIAVYTTFIREEPVHPVGTKFPGGFELHYTDGKYLCPVKDKQLNNPSALCRFCVSEQDKNV
jgi:uncharacterized protein (UPF0305 family)